MTLLLASTFADALGKLNHAEQKQAKLTAFELQLDPTGNGLQMHRIDVSSGFWSARVTGDIRLILHKHGAETTLVWVDHHDAAYRWAERRRMVPHERTGAMQLVQLVEATEDLDPVDLADHAGESKAKDQPFWALDDDQMLDVGVPREWINTVRAMDAEEIDGLFGMLPAEAAEALYDYATGGNLEDHFIAPVDTGGSAFAHPDALRRFRVLENVEELQAALDAPFEKWAVFLHPAQRELVRKDVTGPTRVTGSAGTGKTIVALHRAVHLAKSHLGSRILLTTFSKPLANVLQRKLAVLTAANPDLARGIPVHSLDHAAIELYSAVFGQPNLASTSQIRAIIKGAIKEGLGDKLTAEFLFEEWDELVDAWGVTDPDAYATLPRIGRRTRLGPLQRESAWRVFDQVRKGLSDRKLMTMAKIYSALKGAVADGMDVPYTHVVVDEAQDLTVAQVRFLSTIAERHSDGLFLAGDIGQRIFRLPFSWAKLGLDVRGRSHSLKVNYRTSHQIRTMADRLLPRSITDMDGVEEGRRGVVSTFDGADPVVVIADDEADEAAVVISWLREVTASDIAPSEIGIIVRSQGQLNRGRRAAKGADLPHGDIGPAIVTMHEAKGLVSVVRTFGATRGVD